MTTNKPVLSPDEITSYGANGVGIAVGADCDMLEDNTQSGREKNDHGCRARAPSLASGTEGLLREGSPAICCQATYCTVHHGQSAARRGNHSCLCGSRSCMTPLASLSTECPLDRSCRKDTPTPRRAPGRWPAQSCRVPSNIYYFPLENVQWTLVGNRKSIGRVEKQTSGQYPLRK